MKEVSVYFLENVGRCSDCMRKSFQVAAFSWFTTAIIIALNLQIIGQMLFGFSMLLSALWLLHLSTYAGRNVGLADFGSNKFALKMSIFFRSFAFIAGETAAFRKASPKDRFGRAVGGRPILIELKNSDGTYTAFFKTPDDISALVIELKSRGFVGKMLEHEYWMSTDSCERSAGNKCSNHTCDTTTKSCKQQGIGMAYCRCV